MGEETLLGPWQQLQPGLEMVSEGTFHCQVPATLGAEQTEQTSHSASSLLGCVTWVSYFTPLNLTVCDGEQGLLTAPSALEKAGLCNTVPGTQ